MPPWISLEAFLRAASRAGLEVPVHSTPYPARLLAADAASSRLVSFGQGSFPIYVHLLAALASNAYLCFCVAHLPTWWMTPGISVPGLPLALLIPLPVLSVRIYVWRQCS